LFCDIDSPTSLAFLERFPSATRARWLSEKRLASGLHANPLLRSTRSRHPLPQPRRRAARRVRRRGRRPQRGHTGPRRVLKTIDAQIKRLNAQPKALLAAQLDAHILTSLPRCAAIRAATLIAEIGDCRARFPEPEALACLAGVAPSTTRGRPTPDRDLPLEQQQETPGRDL